MRAVVQKVRSARVVVQTQEVGAVDKGLLVYLGIGRTDDSDQAVWMARKIAGLRIFADETGRMTRCAIDHKAPVLVVSQFTLYGDVRKGRRPSFDRAAPPETARQRYEECCDALRALGLEVSTGRFRSHMEVHAVVDGPVTLLVDSERGF